MADCTNLTRAGHHQGPGTGSSLVWLILFSAVILLSLVTNSIHILGVILTRRLSSLNGLLMLIFVTNILDYSVLAFEFFMGPDNQFPFANQTCAVYQALDQTNSILSSFYLALYCLSATHLRSKPSQILCSVLLVTVFTILLVVPTLLFSEVAVYPSSARHCVVDMSGVGASLGLDITRQHITTAIYNMTYRAGLTFWLPAAIIGLPLVKIAGKYHSDNSQDILTFSLGVSFIMFSLPHAALISARYYLDVLNHNL